MFSYFSALRQQTHGYPSRDGTWDLSYGLIVLAGAALIKVDQSYLVALAILASIAAVSLIRRQVSRRRLGYFRPTRAHKRAEASLTIGLTLVALAMAGVPVLVGRSLPHWEYVMLGGMGAPALLIIAYFYGLKRFYVYALLLLGGAVAAPFFPVGLVDVLLIHGLIVCLTGGLILYRFIRTNPIGKDDDDG